MAGRSVDLHSGIEFLGRDGVPEQPLYHRVHRQLDDIDHHAIVQFRLPDRRQSPAAAVSRIFGFKIVGNGAGGTVSLQVGYEFGGSPQSQIGEDAGQQHCNANAVTVTTDANGNPYSGFTRSGYLCWLEYDAVQHGTFYLFIPTDQNGAPLGEVRTLGPSHSGTGYSYVWTSNGASVMNPNFQFAGWDASNPNKGYATINYGPEDGLLISFVYDSTKAGCNPAYTNWSGAGGYPGWPAVELVSIDTCFTYTNLTNPINNDVIAQITRAYAAANPGFSLAAFTFGSVTYLDDYLRGPGQLRQLRLGQSGALHRRDLQRRRHTDAGFR